VRASASNTTMAVLAGAFPRNRVMIVKFGISNLRLRFLFGSN
jgi:hypothetical protein